MFTMFVEESSSARGVVGEPKRPRFILISVF
jgi:hypothetical protein